MDQSLHPLPRRLDVFKRRQQLAEEGFNLEYRQVLTQAHVTP
jgi:hypothetical protein